MKLAIVGYGRMGREIERLARERGHRIVAVVDPGARGKTASRRLDPRRLGGAEVAFEFTVPAAAETNVSSLLSAGIGVVCGTTGWNTESPKVRRAARSSRAGAVLAPNFSVGMHVVVRLCAEAAKLLGHAGGYDPFVLDVHHRAKRDAPSGTARLLASTVATSDPRAPEIRVGIDGSAVERGAVHVASVRAGHEPGTHVVGFDGEHDAITLTHRARGRAGFAWGAVLAAEWVRGRRGVHGFDRVLDDLLSAGVPPQRRRRA